MQHGLGHRIVAVNDGQIKPGHTKQEESAYESAAADDHPLASAAPQSLCYQSIPYQSL